MHAAQQIVAAIVARLVAAGTDAGSNVFSDRLWPLDASKLPAFRVFEGGEGSRYLLVRYDLVR